MFKLCFLAYGYSKFLKNNFSFFERLNIVYFPFRYFNLRSTILKGYIYFKKDLVSYILGRNHKVKTNPEVGK